MNCDTRIQYMATVRNKFHTLQVTSVTLQNDEYEKFASTDIPKKKNPTRIHSRPNQ